MKQTPKVPTTPVAPMLTSERPPFNLGRFILKSLGWIFAGVFAGAVTAQATGNLPESALGFIIGGGILASFAFTIVPVTRTIKEAQSMASGAADSVNGTPVAARVESLEEGGITLKDTYHEFIFTLTVFPATGEPYQTTIRQYITMGELPNFPSGAYIPFIEDKANPGYGAFNRKLTLPETSQYNGVIAHKTYPDRGRQNSFGGIAKATPAHSAPVSPVRIVASLIFIIIYLVGGFLLPFVVTNSLDTFIQQVQGKKPLTLAERERRSAAESEKEPVLDPAGIADLYSQAAKVIGDRHIKELFIHPGFASFTVENRERKGAYDDVRISDGKVDVSPDPSSGSIKPERTFTLEDAPVESLLVAFEKTKESRPDAPLNYVAFVKSFEALKDPSASGGTTAQEIITALVYVDDPYHSYTARYDVRSNERVNPEDDKIE